MISQERKKEIVCSVEHNANNYLIKKGVVPIFLEETLTNEEEEWYYSTCTGEYKVECCDFNK